MHRAARIRTTWRYRVALAAIVAGGAAYGLPTVAQAGGLVAAYEQYVQGKGFEIKLVNATTGQQLPVPAGVNTPADEFHPAIDGTRLVFTRAELLPLLNGDIVPPAERKIVAVHAGTGAPISILGGVPAELTVTDKGAGATWTPGAQVAPGTLGNPDMLTYGTRFDPVANGTATRPIVAMAGSTTLLSFNKALALTGTAFSAPASGQFLDFPHVSAQRRGEVHVHAISAFAFSESDGTVRSGITRLLATQVDSFGQVVGRPNQVLLGTSTQTVNHASMRKDGHIALDSSSGASADIRTLQFPGGSQPTDAPSPITTPEPERMPAWAPGGIQLGFVRTTGATARRELLVYDSTTGIQTILNPGINLGAEAPTPQLRAFQNTWGGLSLTTAPSIDTPSLTCSSTCLSSLRAVGPSTTLRLAPTVAAKKPVTGTSIGIVVARVAGTKRVLGRSVPRISPIGRVPLGTAKRGKNRFPWNGRVNGRRLPRGTYLLTFRSLNRAGRILSTSRSVRFTVTASGRITGATIQR